MSEIVLSVDSDYNVLYGGKKLGLASPIHLQWSGDPFSHRAHGRVSFDVFELPPPPPPPKNKRRTSTHLGLRRPKK